jgi:replicative DNA helicase
MAAPGDGDRASSAIPFDEAAEQSVLGAILLQPSLLRDLGNVLDPNDFYRESHRAIFRAMLRIDEAGRPLDVLLLANELRQLELFEIAGGSAYLADLSNRVATTVNARQYADIVRKKAAQRSVIAFGRKVAFEATAEIEDVDTFISNLAQEAVDLSKQSADRGAVPLRDALRDAVDHVEKIASQRRGAGGVTGVPTGFRDLDRYTSGWQPSDLVILAARPGMGKTAFALNMLINAAKDARTPTAGVIFSLEMSKEQLATRLWASEAQVPIERLRSADLDQNTWQRLYDRVGKMKDFPVFIDDTPAIPIAEMMRKCRQLKHEHDIGIVMVDYLQLMSAGGQSKQASREQQISEISRNLKALAKELKVPVIALSQLNRGVESRTDKRPQLSDLRESGAIEQDADIIAFLYREDYYQQMKGEAPGGASPNGDAAITEVILAKHRSGSTGKVELRFHAPFTLFSNLPHAMEPPPPGERDIVPKRDLAPSSADDLPPPGPAPASDGFIDDFDPDVPI